MIYVEKKSIRAFFKYRYNKIGINIMSKPKKLYKIIFINLLSSLSLSNLKKIYKSYISHTDAKFGLIIKTIPRQIPSDYAFFSIKLILVYYKFYKIIQ